MGPTRALLISAALIFALVIAAMWLSDRGCGAASKSAAIDAAVEDSAIAPVAAAPIAGAQCVRHARSECDGGDGWWFDSCGRREELREKCDDSLCSDGRCVKETGPKCAGDLSEHGVCDGEVLRYCKHGIAREVDCAVLQKRCLPDDDGEPACIAKVPCTLGTRCAGVKYSFCDRGQQRIGFCPLGTLCTLDGDKPRCVGPSARICARPQLEAEPVSSEATDLPVVAFLVADENVRTAESEERAREAVLAASSLLSQEGHDTGIRIDLRDVRTVQRPRWWNGGAVPAGEIVLDRALQPLPGEPFFVPIVFTHEIVRDEKSVSGFATLPVNRCADLAPFSPPPPPGGAVLISRLRNSTTVVHELGHYLGLCHTFQADPPVATNASDDKGDAGSCDECGRTGDGICDTPVDPGVEACKLDLPSCAVACRDNATPDAFNLMSYFQPCRRYFSTEQARYMRRYLQLRREERSAR